MNFLGMRLSRAAACLAAALSLSWGGAASAAPESGTVFNDWTIHCDAQASQQIVSGCLMIQNVINKENNQPMMVVQIGFVPDASEPAVVITLPLGVLLPAGVAVQVDQNEAIRLPYSWCFPDGCRVRMLLDESQLALFRAGNGGTVTFQQASGQVGSLPFSLSGFTKALASLK